MFKRSKQLTPSITTIGKNTSIHGNIVAKNDNIRLEGYMNGHVLSEAKVVISKTGKMIGEISSISVDVNGYFEGAMHIKNRLRVNEYGIVKGKVNCSVFEVKEGASINAEIKTGILTSKDNILANNDEQKIKKVG